jgi:hypothetical protein
MPIYYGIGNTLISEDEYLEKTQLGIFTRLGLAERKGVNETLDVSGRTLSAEAIMKPLNSDGTPFQPIEYGKPLTAEIRWVYTGNKPKKSWGDATKDMLITSAFKSIATYNEAPRAVNLLRREIHAHSDIQWTATDKGTPLAFFTPAVAETASLATFEVIFDDFPDEIVNKVGDAVATAGSIPIFAAYSVYLLAAGFLLKLVAKAGHSIFDGNVAFRSTETIRFNRPGSLPTPAGWRVLTQETVDDDELHKLTVGPEGQLMTGDKPYAGDLSYVVISLDGSDVDAYKQFTPTAASAALLDKFFRIKDGQMHPVDAVVEGLKLYSDFQFRLKVEKLNKELSEMKSSDPAYEKKKQELEAMKANILHDELKPPKSD